MARNLVFVTGIHGVGKTSRCKNLSDELGFVYLNAGEIIEKEKQTSEISIDKRVSDLDGNQSLLINGMKKYISEKMLLLDGHLTLINKQYEIKKIPMRFLQEINPSLIVVLINKPDKIVENLRKRDSKSYELDLIITQQTMESEYAKQVARDLDIQCVKFNSYDENGIGAFLRNWLDTNADENTD